MRVTSSTGRWVVHSSYEERAIPKAAGCRWDPAAKIWWTDRPEVAAKLREAMDEPAVEALDAALGQRAARIEDSRATDAAVEVPLPDGLALLPYQRAGVAYAIGRQHVLIGDEMGLGKTIQAIAACNLTQPASVLIVCPASLRINWLREWKRWTTLPYAVEIANGSFPESPVVIVNYDILAKHAAALRARSWGVIIYDESHYLKNPKAARTRAALGDKENPAIPAERVLYLTGTPILNRPIELYPILKAARNPLAGSWKYFATRYCAGHQDGYGWRVDGASNLDELQDRLRETIMIRRLKADVLTELPPKRRALLVIDGDTAIIRREQAAWAEQEERLEQVRLRIATAATDAEYAAAIEDFRSASTAAFTEMSKIRHETAIAKLPLVVEHVKEVLESVQKVVVFAHHHDVIDGLVGALEGAVKLDGTMSQEARQEAVDRFQFDPNTRVFVGSIKAAGVGLTLTAASHVIFAELDWVPANITQAEDRCHRIGQHDSVLVEHIVLRDSLDQRIADAIISKQDVSDRALDREHETEIEPMDIPTIPEPKRSVEIPATVNPVFDPEEVARIHHGLRILAGFCDGARSIDGMGFSRLDARIGHELAALQTLSPRQAAIGKRLCHKYRKQLSGEFNEM